MKYLNALLIVVLAVVVVLIGELNYSDILESHERDLYQLQDEITELQKNNKNLQSEIKRLDVNDNGIIIKMSDIEEDMNNQIKSLAPKVEQAPPVKDSVVNAKVNTPKSKDERLSGRGEPLGTFEATAYTDDVASQGKWVGQTATGRDPAVGVIAVDPNIIPLNTKLHVEGYGDCVAGDTGGAIKGKRIDIFLNSSNECKKWGRQQVKVWKR